ncbi:septum formation initiator family protein [Faecalicatena contorta]|nr:septum formation initiator family protein [Faecalicatena contorta]MCF2554738.1 septum formation initiator family protein [Faecalicatena contorta]
MNPHKRSMLAVSFVLVLLLVVVSANSITLRAKDKAYQAQEAELERQIEEEKERSSEIDELEKYVGTDEYIEEVAKEKLGLVNENEIIFKAK